MYTDVFCGTNSLCLCPLNVTFPCTRRFLSRLSASAKRNVVFPELGGPSNNVSLQLSTQNLQVRYYIYTNPSISQFLEYIKSNLRMFSRFFDSSKLRCNLMFPKSPYLPGLMIPLTFSRIVNFAFLVIER